MDLADDFTVNQGTGKWSMIYDQAFYVDLAQGRFHANFKYTVKDTSGAQSEKLSTGDYESFESDCCATMIGFFQTDKKELRCAYATKLAPSINMDTPQAKLRRPQHQKRQYLDDAIVEQVNN